MSPKPLISIIVNTYNRVDLLEQTLKSVFDQKYQPVEIIVYDDGSTDTTPDLINTYKHKLTYTRSAANEGIPHAQNQACKLATGEFIAFQDDDDLMAPNRLISLYQVFYDFPETVLAFGNLEGVDAKGFPIGILYNEDLGRDAAGQPMFLNNAYKRIMFGAGTQGGAVPTLHSSLFRRVDAEKIAWFDEQFWVYDTDFFARLSLLGKVVYVPETMSYYRRGHHQATAQKVKMTIDRFKMIDKHITSIAAHDKSLVKQLRSCLIHSLLLLYFYREEVNTTENPYYFYRNRGLELLDFRGRIAYNFEKLIEILTPFGSTKYFGDG